MDDSANPPNVRLLEDSPLIDRGTADFPLFVLHDAIWQAPAIGRYEFFGMRFRDGFE